PNSSTYKPTSGDWLMLVSFIQNSPLLVRYYESQPGHMGPPISRRSLVEIDFQKVGDFPLRCTGTDQLQCLVSKIGGVRGAHHGNSGSNSGLPVKRLSVLSSTPRNVATWASV